MASLNNFLENNSDPTQTPSKNRGGNTPLYSFYEASINLVPKADKDIIGKQINIFFDCRCKISLMKQQIESTKKKKNHDQKDLYWEGRLIFKNQRKNIFIES